MKRSESRFSRIALVVFFGIALLYALYEARGVLSGPVIEVPERIILAESEFVTIEGRADRISELRMNGEQIPVTEEGFFAEPYVLARGVNRIILEARDARGRETRQVMEIVYSGETTLPMSGTPGGGTSTPTSSSGAVY